jgi:hypothetical protein
MKVDDLILKEVEDNFKLALKIRARAEEIVEANTLDMYCSTEKAIEILLLAYICAKQTKHHIVEESLLMEGK